MTNYYEDCTTWRLEKIIHIKSNVNSDGMNDDFKELFEDLDPDCKSHKQIFEKIPELSKLYEDSDECPEKYEVMDFFQSYERYQNGFFVQVAAQVPMYRTESIFAIGWGYYQTHWLYVTDLSDAEEFAHNLAEQIDSDAKQEFLNKVA